MKNPVSLKLIQFFTASSFIRIWNFCLNSLHLPLILTLTFYICCVCHNIHHIYIYLEILWTLAINQWLSSLHHLSLFLAVFSFWNYRHITYWRYDLNILRPLFCHYCWYPLIYPILSILFLEDLLYPLLADSFILPFKAQFLSFYLNDLSNLTVFNF